MRGLAFELNPTTIELLKCSARMSLPNVAHSHRLEAVARGFGYGSFAALNHAALSPVTVTPDHVGAFEQFFLERNYSVEGKALLRTIVDLKMRYVLDKHPKVSSRGFGLPSAFQLGETLDQRRARFEADQADLLSDDSADQVLLSLAFLERVRATKTCRPGTHPGRLKHIAERYDFDHPAIGRMGPRYVATGVMIASAMLAGFRYDSKEDQFNMSLQDIDALDIEIRPDGYKAQAKARSDWFKARKARYPRGTKFIC